MKKFEFLKELTESRLFKSERTFDSYTESELREFFYLNVLALSFLFLSEETRKDASKYADDTASLNNFEYFRMSGNDLYLLTHALVHKYNVDLDQNFFRVFLRAIARGNDFEWLYQYLFALERKVKVKDSDARSMRRFILGWHSVNAGAKKQVLTRLAFKMKSFSILSDLYRDIDKLSKSDTLLEYQDDGQVTQQDLIELEKYLDALYAQNNIDFEFTRHFLDRVNDPRNQKQITVDELKKLFKDVQAKYGKKIAQMGPDKEAVMVDISSQINSPFVLQWDRGAEQLDLITKTVMRKKNFMTRNPKLTV